MGEAIAAISLCRKRTSAAPFTSSAWPPTRLGWVLLLVLLLEDMMSYLLRKAADLEALLTVMMFLYDYTK